jgi:HlyD family secretion protein
MHPNPRRILPIVLLLVLAAGAYWWWTTQNAAAADTALTNSGTIEATQSTIASEVLGRVLTVEVAEGDSVTAGQPLITLDAALLEAQRQQAQASLRAIQGTHQAAEAALAAAQANYNLLVAGATEAQLNVAESAVRRAEATLEGAETAVENLPEAAQGTSQAQQLDQQVEIASAALDNARAQLALLEAGARPEQLAAAHAQVEAAEAQVQATQGQVESATAALAVLDVQQLRFTLVSPIDGVVLSRAIQPGEVASPGGVLLELAELSNLTLTVYIPETDYGTITIGQNATVTVDSFPGERFTATVAHIADQAEFTPRNAQTVEGRRLTVYAVELHLNNPDGKLKPGMPADVTFAE